MFRVAVIVSVETPDTEEVNHLHVFFFFRADEAAHHLFLVFIDVGQVEVETDLRRLCLSAEVHQAVHAYVVLAEGRACAQVVQRYEGTV